MPGTGGHARASPRSSRPIRPRSTRPINPNRDWLEANAALWSSGTTRPTSTSGTPGIAGRFFLYTSGVNSGRLDLDTGTSWITIGGAKTFSESPTWTLDGPIGVATVGPPRANFILPKSVVVTSGETVALASMRWRLGNGASGTSVQFKLQRNGSDITGFGTTASPLVAGGATNTTAWTTVNPTDVHAGRPRRPRPRRRVPVRSPASPEDLVVEPVLLRTAEVKFEAVSQRAGGIDLPLLGRPRLPRRDAGRRPALAVVGQRPGRDHRPRRERHRASRLDVHPLRREPAVHPGLHPVAVRGRDVRERDPSR